MTTKTEESENGAAREGGSRDFLRAAVAADVAAGKNGGKVVTRFPPEPNAYLHIGHAKAIGISFCIAAEFGGHCNLRFDDTNPLKEEQEYVDAIIEDVSWLGFKWHGEVRFASDYFDQFYMWACELIAKGLAYVDDQSADQIRATRGTLTEPGVNSPHRHRSVEENLDLFARMKAAEFPEGSRVLRAKIDMASPNPNLRDPVMYRIIYTHHHRTDEEWCIYPMYDWGHGQGDSIEGVTHSLCSLEFEDHRPLYEWYIEQLGIFPSRQIEFARGNITYTITSKRRLLELIEGGHVNDWDDPRMPTLRGLRRRGVPPEGIRRFWTEVGVAKRENNVEVSLLEHCIRDHLNKVAPRVMGVLSPLKVVIENYPEGSSEELEAINNPEDTSAGVRQVPFGRDLYIEREDFMEDPPKRFFRLAPGREVRLRYAYFITCNEVIMDDAGEVVELRCSYDPATRGGDAPDGRKVKATLHWVSTEHAVEAEMRLYDRLFQVEDPTKVEGGVDWKQNLNPDSLHVLEHAYVEPAAAELDSGASCQFERLGYFCVDPDTTAGKPVFNRTVTLRDTWARLQKQGN
ncbi:MAG: glutamine--tRNA ligase/YqeY domain fusion protein [Candidatus Latescibacterota bacterium]|nr:glutamine--tRNA ligase/YqeY domain fusion protein [Candidatus Latescibacterota bacterium]